MITAKEILTRLLEGMVSLPPLTFRVLNNKRNKASQEYDALLEIAWGGKKVLFNVEIKASSFPKTFKETLDRIKYRSQQSSKIKKSTLFMLLVPYLNEDQLLELEESGISGIDLCGNGVVIVPGSFSIFRSGEKNSFLSSALIKNVYSRRSSLVGRYLLVKRMFNSVKEIVIEVNDRIPSTDSSNYKPLSFSTVSKVLKSLENDLIIERNSKIALIQPDKLLEKLQDSCVTPIIKKRVKVKVPGKLENSLKSIMLTSWADGLPCIITGLSSTENYAVMPRGETVSIYSPDIDRLLNELLSSKSTPLSNIKTDNRFPNIEILETDDETVYFDNRYDGKLWWASPVQTYLELMAGDKRDQETADQVKSFILNNIR